MSNSSYAQQTCQFGPPTTDVVCPPGNTSTTIAYCSSESLKSNIILRCMNGCPQPGNCNQK